MLLGLLPAASPSPRALSPQSCPVSLRLPAEEEVVIKTADCSGHLGLLSSFVSCSPLLPAAAKSTHCSGASSGRWSPASAPP